jgi:uncharacterized protein YraI
MGMMMKMNPSANLTNNEGRHTAMTQRLVNTQLMTRRAALRTLGTGSLALALAGVMARGGVGTAAAAQAVQQYKTTTAVNFRAGPGTNYSVIQVIPAGGIVVHTGAVQNSFSEVSYGGTYGWVHKDYLVPVSGPAPVISGQGWTMSSVNLRSGPGTTYAALRVVPSGALIGTSTTVQNGFRSVAYQGQAGWMADAYISFTNGNGDDQGGHYKTTTASLNLRAEPSTTAKILTVIPAGARVQLLHTQVGQFVNVNYNGQQGWVAAAYLR